MKFIIKYNLEILTIYTLVMLGVLVVFWDSFVLVQRFTIGFLGLITMHEWEESRFPGGFYKMMGSIMKVDLTRVPAEYLHLPVAVYIVVITLLPLLFPGIEWLFLAVIYLGIFEGFVHVAGIKLSRSNKPYTPGMITAEMMLVYSVAGIYFAASKGLAAPLDWLLGFVVFIGGFMLLEISGFRIMGLKPADVMKGMRENLKSMRG